MKIDKSVLEHIKTRLNQKLELLLQNMPERSALTKAQEECSVTAIQKRTAMAMSKADLRVLVMNIISTGAPHAFNAVPGFNDEFVELQKQVKAANDRYQTKAKALRAEKEAILDRIIFGGEDEEIMALVRSFLDR